MTLHEIEDRARWVDLDSPEGRTLQRMYARKLNQLWQRKVTPKELYEHERRRIHRFTGPDYFRARTIARNAITALITALGVYGDPRYGHRRYTVAEPEPEVIKALAVKTARAVRRVRPELFTEGPYRGVEAIDA